MSIKQYNKLVRDRIPEIIEASGKNCVTEILSDADYLKMLDAKLDEELAEYHARRWKSWQICWKSSLLRQRRGAANWSNWSISAERRHANEALLKRKFF